MNLLRKAAVAAKMATALVRNLSVREPDDWIDRRHIASSGEVVNERTAAALSAVWSCTNLVAGTIGSLPVRVMQTRGDGSKRVALDHPLARLLNTAPNYDQTSVDFWEFMAAAVELHGNAYARIVRSGDRVVALEPVAPAIMSVRRTPEGPIEYTWTDRGEAHKVTDADMLHVRGPGGDTLCGASVLSVGRDVIGAARAAETAAASTFRNGLRPSGVLSFADWLTKDQREIAENRLTEKFLGAINAGKPLVLEGGTSWQQLTITPGDAQLLEARGFSVEEVCRLFSVPPFMVGHTQKSTSWGTGIEQQTLGFLKFSLRRRIKRFEAACERKLLTPADRANGVSIEFNIEGLLRADSKGRAEFYRTMTAIGAMTINEARMLEGLPPVEGGDVPRMQAQNVPITETEAIAPPMADEGEDE